MSTIKLSTEQLFILSMVEPPNKEKGKLVRVNAAAGTGKTTTLLKLAERAADLGHHHITYVTFNKSAAADGQRRLGAVLDPAKNILNCRSIHGCAMTLLAKHRREPNMDNEHSLEERILDDDQLQQEIERICMKEISSFLEDCYSQIHQMARGKGALQTSMQNAAYKQVLHFLIKTMSHFCRSSFSLKRFHDPSNSRRNYFPVQLYHSRHKGGTGKGEKAGFVGYENRTSWYADTVCLLWEKIEHVRTYDLEMKRAQLLGLVIPGSLLLVDEAQDCDGCQIDWMAQQVQHRKQVFLVGDAAQTIYSFRGAKSKYMTELKADHDCTLRTSWRFGPSIAKIANVVLFAKEKSPQSTGYTKTWRPYRVIGGGDSDCKVTTESLLHNWKNAKLTLIASTNATLLKYAVGLLGMENKDLIEDCKGEHVPDVVSSATEGAVPDVVRSGTRGDVPYVIPSDILYDLPNKVRREKRNTNDLPKIHINGRGENSGMKKWKQMTKQIEMLYRLFKFSLENIFSEMSLPSKDFPEFADSIVSWQTFVQGCQDRELNKYSASICVIENFRSNTMQAIDLFRDEIMMKNFTSEEADIILSTCHAAKGMEWSAVQLCDDFLDLVKVDNKGPQLKCHRNEQQCSKQPKNNLTTCTRSSWQFSFNSYGDDVNILYVACTRAKKVLSLPESFYFFLSECDLLHDLISSKNDRVDPETVPTQTDEHETAKIVVFAQKKAITSSEAFNLYEDICLPLRLENSLLPNQQQVNVLIQNVDARPHDYVQEICATQET